MQRNCIILLPDLTFAIYCPIRQRCTFIKQKLILHQSRATFDMIGQFHIQMLQFLINRQFTVSEIKVICVCVVFVNKINKKYARW